MNRQTSSFISIIVEKIQRVKKTDWIALALAGAICLILAMPTESTEKSGEIGSTTGFVDTSDTVGSAYVKLTETTPETRAKEYVTGLEEKLKEVLSQMEGVGAVEVMITISDYGEYVAEKDIAERSSTLTELDSGNADKTSIEQEYNEETVHVEDENGSYPYIEKEILPTIEGIVVVAEGGGNTMVVSNISKAALALFPIEAHKIIVVKMSDKGDSP